MDKADIKEKKGPQVESKNKSNVDKKISKSKFDIECMLVPSIKIGQLLEIESTLFKGQVVVKECNFVASGLETFTVSASVEVV